MYAKLKPLSPSKRPKGTPPVKEATRAQLLARERAAARQQAVASETRASISAFEASLRYSAVPATEEPVRPFTTGNLPDGTPGTVTAAATHGAVSLWESTHSLISSEGFFVSLDRPPLVHRLTMSRRSKRGWKIALWLGRWFRHPCLRTSSC